MNGSLKAAMRGRSGRGFRVPAQRGEDREAGQILVLFTLVLILVLLAVSIVVDLGLLRNNRQTLVNAVDAGALAGGTLMPVDGPAAAANAASLIDKTIKATYPGLPTSAYTIQYRCLIGIGAGVATAFDSQDIVAFTPRDCNPSNALGHSPGVVADFIGAGATRTSACRPDLGDKCNVVMVSGNAETPYSFGRIVGVNSGYTGTVQAAACKGLCGETPTSFDVELVIDTSGSMNGSPSGSGPCNPSPCGAQPRIYWAKDAANKFVDYLNLPQYGGVGPSGNRIGISTFSGTTATSLNTWALGSAALKTAVNGITAAGSTPLKVGMATGATDLTTNTRNSPGNPAPVPANGSVRRIVILLSDGRPNPDQGPNGVAATLSTGQRPKSPEINGYLASADEAFSIAIGTGGAGASQVDLGLMQLLEKGDPLVVPPAPHFFNVINGNELVDVFSSIATQLVSPHPRLIRVYQPPVVSSVTPTLGKKNTTVTISGYFFTGTTSVEFGGTSAAFSVTSDTTIVVNKAPAHASGTVDITVTTPGGVSPVVSGDRFTYQ